VAGVFANEYHALRNFSMTPYMWSIVSMRERGMSNTTTGSMFYPQNMPAVLVISGQYACSVDMRYVVSNDLLMFPSSSWYQLSVRPSGLVARWSMIIAPEGAESLGSGLYCIIMCAGLVFCI